MQDRVYSVGEAVERELDGIFYKAIVLDIYLSDRDATYSYDLLYDDDGNRELNVPGTELRFVRGEAASGADGAESGHVSAHVGAASRESPRHANDDPPPSYNEVARHANDDPPPSYDEVASSTKTCISLDTFRKIMKGFSRAAKSICVGYSQDEWFNGKARRQRSFLDTSGGAARRRYKRRLSWGGFSVSDDEKLSRSIILFTPFANRCDNCNKWTVFRCKRCNSKFFCCRSCQQESWPLHSLTCEEIPFRDLFEYSSVVRTHQLLVGVSVDAASNHRSQGSSTKSICSMNPLHGVHARTQNPAQEIEMSVFDKVKEASARNKALGLTTVAEEADDMETEARTSPTTVRECHSDAAVHLSAMFDVSISVAEDALSRNRGDANLAAEWLLTLPSYVDANKTNYEGYEHSKRNDQAKSERAELDATAQLESRPAPRPAADEDEWEGDAIELFSGQYSIKGRNCDVTVIQRSVHDYSTTITILPRSHLSICPIKEEGGKSEKVNVISYTPSGSIEKVTVAASDHEAGNGCPPGFHVVVETSTLDDDDDMYETRSVTFRRPSDHVIVVSSIFIKKLIAEKDKDNQLELLEMSENANFQRAKLILKSLTPRYISPFSAATALQSDYQVSSTPIRGETKFLKNLILVYKVLGGESGNSTYGQSVRPERVFIRLGAYEVEERYYPPTGQEKNSTSKSDMAYKEAKNELFKGARIVPIITTNPFADETPMAGGSSQGYHDCPPLIDITDNTALEIVIRPDDVNAIKDMFGLSTQDAESYLQRTQGDVQMAAELILSGQD